MRKISKLEKETATKQITLEQVCCSEHTCKCVWDACMCVIVMWSYYDDVALKLYTYITYCLVTPWEDRLREYTRARTRIVGESSMEENGQGGSRKEVILSMNINSYLYNFNGDVYILSMCRLLEALYLFSMFIISLCLFWLCRDLETRMGTTPPPSPSDKMDHVALNARVVQLSNEVDRLKKLLSKTESKRESFVLLLTVQFYVYT